MMCCYIGGMNETQEKTQNLQKKERKKKEQEKNTCKLAILKEKLK